MGDSYLIKALSLKLLFPSALYLICTLQTDVILMNRYVVIQFAEDSSYATFISFRMVHQSGDPLNLLGGQPLSPKRISSRRNARSLDCSDDLIFIAP